VAREFEQAIPNTTLVVIPGAGQISNLEQPEPFRQAALVVARRPGRRAGPRSRRTGDALRGAILVVWGLCADGHTNAQGRPSPLYGALLGTSYRREVRFRQPPDPIQRLLFPPLAALASPRFCRSSARGAGPRRQRTRCAWA
jgi:hypothetical protein